MANLQEVVNDSRESGSNNPARGEEYPTNLHNAQRSGPKPHPESDGLADPEKNPASGQPERGWEEDRDKKQNTQQHTDGMNPSTKIQDQFYQKYRELAEECDKEFFTTYNEDLNTTLIFAGLFSAVASAFIIDVNSELKPNPNDDTAALLRVLLYKIDNTTFGTDVPLLPQWTGPSRGIVQVQAVLFASLCASLLSAFLAVLGKQWLSRYDSADMKGTAIERAQNRQRKLDGVDAWNFHYVMEALPLMLQTALLLLAGALSRYLWETNTIVASVVIGITSLGMAFYLFVIVAGTVDKSCPYQTPVVNILRQTLRLFKIPPQPHATDDYQKRRLDLRCIWWILHISLDKRLRRLAFDYLWTIPRLPHVEPTLVSDCFNIFLGCINVGYYGVVVKEESKQLVTAAATSFLRTSSQLLATDPTSSAAIDLRRNYRKIFEYSSLTRFNHLPFRFTMIAIHSLIGEDRNFHDISWNGDRPSIPEHILFTQYALRVAWQRYKQSQHKKVPRWTLRFVFYSLSLDPPPPAFIVANCLQIIAIDLDCDVLGDGILESVRVEDLLSVEVESFFTAEAEKTWSAQVESISGLIAQKLDAMVGTNGPDSGLIISKRKAIWTLLPHTAYLRQPQWELIITDTLRTGAGNPRQSLRRYAGPFATTLFDKPSAHTLDRAVLLASSQIPFFSVFWDNSRVSKWSTIALNALKDERAVNDTVVSESVADTLLQFGSRKSLRLQIPAETWVWLRKPRSLPTLSYGREYGTTGDVVRHIRGLGDIEILKSYFLLVWSKWDHLRDRGLCEMEISIQEDFGGVGRWRDREELIERLDRVLGQLSLGPAHFKQHLPPWKWESHAIEVAVSQYSSLRNTLLNAHEVYEGDLLRSHLTFTCALPLPCP